MHEARTLGCGDLTLFSRITYGGGAACGMKGGRHIKYEKGTPLANLHLTLVDRVGVRLDSFADSDGKIEDLFDPVAV